LVKLLTLARDLQRRKGRERQHRFVAEGVRTVEALLASPLTVTGLLVTDALPGQARGLALLQQAQTRGVPVQVVTGDELASASDTDAPQGVLAVADIPSAASLAPDASARYLVLDALQDPGNVGTVVRTAAALGVTATIALPGTVDFWNAKVVRSSMGALFHHPVATMGWNDLAAFLAQHRVALWAADLNGDPLPEVAAGALPERLALVVSNEGAGLSPHVAAAVERRLRIPMAQTVESFNVAAAAAIVLYALGVAQPAARSS
jgi:TrmH family RNA methyltransferase